MILGIFLFIWLRGTLPRLRYDQFMAFGWKVLVPVALVWILFVGTFSVLRSEGYSSRKLLAGRSCVLAVIIVPHRAGSGRRAGRTRTRTSNRRPDPGCPAAARSRCRRWTCRSRPRRRLRAREPVRTVPASDADVIDSDDPSTGESR